MMDSANVPPSLRVVPPPLRGSRRCRAPSESAMTNKCEQRAGKGDPFEWRPFKKLMGKEMFKGCLYTFARFHSVLFCLTVLSNSTLVMTARPMDYGVGINRVGMTPTALGAFDYNKSIPVEDSQIRGKDSKVEPLGGVSNQSGTWIITIDPSNNEYVSLKDTVLETKMKVVKSDGKSSIDALSCSVAPNNLMAVSMWENIDVRLNGTPMSGASAVNIGYKAYMETLLSYDNDASMSHLVCQGYHPDSPGELETHRLPLSHIKRTFYEMVANGDITPELPNTVTNKWYKPGEVKNEDGALLDDDAVMALNLENSKKYNEALETYFNTWMKGDTERETNRMGSLYGLHDTYNHGFVARAGICEGSQVFTVIGPVPHNFFSLNNHLSPLNKVEIKLTRYPDRFLLNTEQFEKGYKLMITDMRLHLKTVIRRERIPIPMKEVYEMNETQLYKQVIPSGLQTFNFRMVNTGILPKTVIMGMVSTAACEGTYNLNPFNFHHFKLSRLSLLINGEEHPQGGLEFKWKKLRNPDIMRAYQWLFANSGALANERGNLITHKAFASGSFILPFDLTHDRCSGAHQHNAEFGYIDVQMAFEDALEHSVTVLYELVYNKVLMNDKTMGTVQVVDIAV
jgi:hypothetical protein